MIFVNLSTRSCFHLTNNALLVSVFCRRFQLLFNWKAEKCGFCYIIRLIPLWMYFPRWNSRIIHIEIQIQKHSDSGNQSTSFSQITRSRKKKETWEKKHILSYMEPTMLIIFFSKSDLSLPFEVFSFFRRLFF